MATEPTIGTAYDRCAYLNCCNGKYNTGHKLFRFPAASDPRHDLWIEYSGNPRVRTWASTTVRRAGICADHFEPKHFTDKTRRSLRRNAIPKPYSAEDAQAKPSPKLLAPTKSLPEKQTKSREIDDSEEVEIEFETHCSQTIPVAKKRKSAPVKPMLIQTQAPKTLRKVKRIKIEEQNSNTNKTVILERCKNPQTCPANKQAAQENGKPRPHFHKVYVTKSAKTQTIPKTNSKCEEKGKPDDHNYVLAQKTIESCEDNTNIDVEIRKKVKKSSFRTEKIHIDLAKPSPKKEEPSTTSRYTGEPENFMFNWQAIQEARAASEKEKDQINNDRKPSKIDLIEEYYKSENKVKCLFDRCVYINCKNGKFTTGARLFRFPQINDPRLVKWMKNAGNPKMLDWSWSTIRRAGLCADHFSRESFFNETRNRLLRTAIPKPFYLKTDESAGNEQAENMPQDDLLKVLAIIENEQTNCKQNFPKPASIDLPSENSPRRNNLIIRYPFEDPEVVESDEETEIKNSNNSCENEEYPESFSNVTVKTEIIDHSENEETDEFFATTSGLIDIKEEPEEDNFDDENESEEDDNNQNILAIQKQKARFCKVVKEFSTKLENAKIRKYKLHTRLHDRDMKMLSFG